MRIRRTTGGNGERRSGASLLLSRRDSDRHPLRNRQVVAPIREVTDGRFLGREKLDRGKAEPVELLFERGGIEVRDPRLTRRRGALGERRTGGVSTLRWLPRLREGEGDPTRRRKLRDRLQHRIDGVFREIDHYAEPREECRHVVSHTAATK